VKFQIIGKTQTGEAIGFVNSSQGSFMMSLQFANERSSFGRSKGAVL
jgi:hypothetical protein